MDGQRKKRSQFEREKLLSYVTIVLQLIIKPRTETMPLFQDLISHIVDERLHLKTFGSDTVILDAQEKLDSILVVLEGEVTLTDQSGRETTVLPHQIVGLEKIPTIDLLPNKPLSMDPITFGKRVKSAKFPVQRTDLLSIYFDEIVTIYQRIQEKEMQAQMNTISKIKWFSLLEPASALAFKNELSRIKMSKGSIIYDIGQSSDHFYLLQEGQIRIDSMFEIEQIRKHPVVDAQTGAGDRTEWTVLNQKVLRTV